MLKSLIAFRLNELPLHIKRFWINWSNRKINLITELGCEIQNVKFGKHVFFGQNVVMRNSVIGDYSYVNKNSTILNTRIGKFCSIGPQVQIVIGNHPMNLVSTHPAFYANNKLFQTFSDKNYVDEYLSVEIGNDVWIGEGVLIPGGIKIGDGAIIAARAVVTKDVPPYSVVGGVPAKLIRYRFDPSRIEYFLKIKWWNWDEDKLKLKYKEFLNPLDFIANNKQ